MTKRQQIVWYGGLSGPMAADRNVRCRFAKGAPELLDRIGLVHDIRFTHLWGRPHAYRPEYGTYVAGHVRPVQQLGDRYLVALDGNGQPGCLSWMFGVNSLVFRNRSRWHCLLDDFFFPGHDYLEFENDLSDFETKVRYALEHDRDMKTIVFNSTTKMLAVTQEWLRDVARATLRRVQECDRVSVG